MLAHTSVDHPSVPVTPDFVRVDFERALSVLVCTHLYIEHYPDGEVKLASSVIWTAAGGEVGLWCTVYLVFLLTIAAPNMRRTLLSTENGRVICLEAFLKEGADVVEKFGIFAYNSLMWEARIGGEVKEWTFSKWKEWERENPKWFDARIVPDEYIPRENLKIMGNLTGGDEEVRLEA